MPSDEKNADKKVPEQEIVEDEKPEFVSGGW